MLSHFLAQHQKAVNVVPSKKEIYVTMAVNQLSECRQDQQDHPHSHIPDRTFSLLSVFQGVNVAGRKSFQCSR